MYCVYELPSTLTNAQAITIGIDIEAQRVRGKCHARRMRVRHLCQKRDTNALSWRAGVQVCAAAVVITGARAWTLACDVIDDM